MACNHSHGCTRWGCILSKINIFALADQNNHFIGLKNNAFVLACNSMQRQARSKMAMSLIMMHNATMNWIYHYVLLVEVILQITSWCKTQHRNNIKQTIHNWRALCSNKQINQGEETFTTKPQKNYPSCSIKTGTNFTTS